MSLSLSLSLDLSKMSQTLFMLDLARIQPLLYCMLLVKRFNYCVVLWHFVATFLVLNHERCFVSKLFSSRYLYFNLCMHTYTHTYIYMHACMHVHMDWNNLTSEIVWFDQPLSLLLFLMWLNSFAWTKHLLFSFMYAWDVIFFLSCYYV